MKAIILTRGRIAIVDDEDFDRVNQFKWSAVRTPSGKYYAQRSQVVAGKRHPQYMSHFVLGLRRRLDHINGDGTDNRKENLRPATSAENARAHRRKNPAASSRFRGVSWGTAQKKWRADLGIHGRIIYLGLFDDEEGAARAYDAKARELFGQFATPNFPE